MVYKVKQERLADGKVKEVAEEIQQEKENLSHLSEGQLADESPVTSGDETEVTEELESEGRIHFLQISSCISLINLSFHFLSISY